MAKQFNKKYMHPTRRKLVDMVLHGSDYETNTSISLSGAENKNIKREIGDIWTDSSGATWEQKSYGKVTHSKLSDTMSDVRQYLVGLNKCKGDNCETIKYSHTDKNMIKASEYCLDCITKLEHIVRVEGMWDTYEKYRVYSNMVDYGKDIIDKLKESYRNAKQTYDYVNSDGRLETWTMDTPVDEFKQEIQNDIDKITDEIKETNQLKLDTWDKLKDKGYNWIKFNDTLI